MHDKGALYNGVKRSHPYGKFFFHLIYYFTLRIGDFVVALGQCYFLMNTWKTEFFSLLNSKNPSFLINPRVILVNYKNINKTLARVVANGHSYWFNKIF